MIYNRRYSLRNSDLSIKSYENAKDLRPEIFEQNLRIIKQNEKL